MSGARALKDRYGFFFWLRWILWFSGSFVVAALGWTFLFKQLFGAVRGAELTLTWMVCVFGSWFILVIPFMRKKEQIWKRLNTDQERAVDAWLMGMSIFIGSLVMSALGWGIVFKPRLHTESAGMDGVWMKAVFGTWLAVLIPFLIFMYRKADFIFQTARMRQTYEPNYRQAAIPREERLLPQALADRLAAAKPILPKGHLIHAKLKDGSWVKYLFILNGNEIAGIYDRERLDFDPRQIEEIQIVSEELPVFDPTRWLRLDLSDLNS